MGTYHIFWRFFTCSRMLLTKSTHVIDSGSSKQHFLDNCLSCFGFWDIFLTSFLIFFNSRSSVFFLFCNGKFLWSLAMLYFSMLRRSFSPNTWNNNNNNNNNNNKDNRHAKTKNNYSKNLKYLKGDQDREGVGAKCYSTISLAVLFLF